MTQTSQPEIIAGIARCWFCEQELADSQSTVTARLRKEEKREYKKIIYATKVINIPRCTQCAKQRKTIKNISTIATILLFGFIAAGFAINLLLPENFPWFIAPCAGGLLWLGFFWFVVIRRGMHSGTMKNTTIAEYPEVKETLKEKGWHIYEVNHF